MHVASVKISSKGQIVLPKAFREQLTSNVLGIEWSEEGDKLTLYPLHDLSGALKEYQKTSKMSFKEIREQAWKENTKDRG